MTVIALRNNDEPQTLNARVFHKMRSDILTCKLLPNERMRMEPLRERYQTGASPIREALMRLEAEGLVELEQNKGFRVAAVSREKLYDLMASRIEIEGIILRWSIEKGGVGWEADLLGAFHRLSRQDKHNPEIPGNISEDWTVHHRAFHFALISACNSPTLIGIRNALFDKSELYLFLSITSSAKPRDDVAEHQGLMDAALNHDVDLAISLNREHIEATTEKVAASDAVEIGIDNRKATIDVIAK